MPSQEGTVSLFPILGMVLTIFTHPDLNICLRLYALVGCTGQSFQRHSRLHGRLQSFSCSVSRCSEYLVCRLHLSITCAPTGMYYYSCKSSSPAWHLGLHICAKRSQEAASPLCGCNYLHSTITALDPAVFVQQLAGGKF